MEEKKSIFSVLCSRDVFMRTTFRFWGEVTKGCWLSKLVFDIFDIFDLSILQLLTIETRIPSTRIVEYNIHNNK